MIIGEPLGSRVGVLAYAVQSSWGTAVTPNVCAGILGFDYNENPDLEEIAGIGSANTQFTRYRGQKNEATINISHLQNIDFLTQGIRSSGALPILTVAFGIQDDAGTKWAQVFQDCKINSWEATIEQEGPLAVSATLYLGKVVNSSAITRPSALTEFPLQWIDGIVTVGGVGKLLKSGRIGVEHNLTRDFPVRASAATADEARLPYRLREGMERISAAVTLFQSLGISRQVDVPAAATTIQWAFTSRANASNTATFALSGVRAGEERMTSPADGDIEFASSLIATGIALS